MTDVGIVLAHGGHGSGGTIWLLIALVIVGLLLWRSTRAGSGQAPRNLGPLPKKPATNEGTGKDRKEVDSTTHGGA